MHVAGGSITEVDWGSMGDWPEFALVTSSGERSLWTRQGDHTRNVEGVRVHVSYVVQHFKDAAPAPSVDRSTKVVLRIDIEDSPRRSPAPAPGPLGRTAS